MDRAGNSAGSLGVSSAVAGKGLSGLTTAALAFGPAMATLGGVAAGAGVALAGAFTAAAGALAGFGAIAKPVLTDASKAAEAVGKAQDAYNIAIANGTPKAAAYKTEQIAIGKAYAGMSPAQIQLSRQLGGMADAWDKVKAAETPVVAGALQPWLRSITDLMGMLKPVIDKVAPVIHDLGVKFDALVKSDVAARFRDFTATFGALTVKAAGSTLIDFFKAFMIILPKFSPLIGQAAGGIGKLGPAVLTWANSKRTADHITAFMAWFKTNGPLVKDLLKNIGGALKALAPGLTSGATVELKLISGFFGFIAKLPPGLAKPLAEVAGALLILNKLGVVSVGFKLLGLAGAGGAGAAGAAAGGAVAGGLWSKILPGAKLIGGALVISLVIQQLLQNPKNDKVLGNTNPQSWWNTWEPQKNSIIAKIQDGGLARGISNFAKGAGVALSGLADTARRAFGVTGISADNLRTNNLTPLQGEVGKVSGGIQGLAGIMNTTLLNAERAAGAHSDNLRTKNLAPLQGAVGQVSGGIQGLSRYINPGLTGATNTGGAHVNSFRTNNLGPLRGELARDSGGVQGLQGLINAMHGTTVHVNFVGSGSGSIAFKQSIPGVTTGPSSQGILGFHAAGGLIRMGTGPTSDDVPAMLSHGEYVHRSKAVSKYGVPAMEAVNAGKAVIGYASGGPVGVTGAIGANGMFTAGQPYMANTEAAFGRKVEQAWASAVIAKFKKDAAASGSVFGTKVPNVGSGVMRWAPLVLQALKMESLGAYLASQVLYQMMTESGGNPNAINLWDSNAQRGDPSRGLMQTIGSTFRAYHWPGTSWNIYDPLANIAAAINYARHVYGPSLGALGSGHGYAQGGRVQEFDQGGILRPGVTLAVNNTGRDEHVIPGYAAGGFIGGNLGQQGSSYLKAWQTRHGGGFGAAWAPVVLNQQIAAMTAAITRASHPVQSRRAVRRAAQALGLRRRRREETTRHPQPRAGRGTQMADRADRQRQPAQHVDLRRREHPVAARQRHLLEVAAGPAENRHHRHLQDARLLRRLARRAPAGASGQRHHQAHVRRRRRQQPRRGPGLRARPVHRDGHGHGQRRVGASRPVPHLERHRPPRTRRWRRRRRSPARARPGRLPGRA